MACSHQACEEKKKKEAAAVFAGPSLPDTSQPLVTGTPQLDSFLYTHLKHALQLLQVRVIVSLSSW